MQFGLNKSTVVTHHSVILPIGYTSTLYTIPITCQSSANGQYASANPHADRKTETSITIATNSYDSTNLFWLTIGY